MAYVAYLDCGGDATDPSARVIAVAGFIAHQTQWEEFERRWRGVLSSYGVSALHMKDYAHSTIGSDFERWKGDEGKRAAFMSELTDVINDCAGQQVSTALSVKAYASVNNHLLLRETIGPPYAAAAFITMALCVEWHQKQSTSEPLILIYEHGDNEQASLFRLLGRFMTSDIDFVTGPITQKKSWIDKQTGERRYCVPFQAADFLAYENHKLFSDFIKSGKRTARQSLFKVSYPPRSNHHLNRIVLTAKQVRTLAGTLRVQPRYNHSIGGSDDGMRSEPLAYLGMDQPLISFASPESLGLTADRKRRK